MVSSHSRPRRWNRAILALAGLPLVLTSSCKLFTATVNAPGKVASGLMGGDKKQPEKLPPSLIQAGVMRFADTFASRITQATQEFADKAGTPEARIQAMTWSIGQNTSAFTIATGPNSRIAMLDMIVLVTLGRMVHEEYWMPKVWGEADRPMVDAFVAMEKEAWLAADHVLDDAQKEAVRATLREWREQNPDMSVTAFVRLPPFREIVESGKASGKNFGTALGDLLTVDPLSGLEPAVAEIEQTRLFAERALYYAQRAPLILSTQIELLGFKLMLIPEVHSALADSQRISLAAASLAETAAKLPESVRTEREEAIRQLADALTQQRQGLVTDLERVQAPAEKILTDAKATLDSGAQMSTALQGAITALDGFIAGFEPKEPPPGTPPPPPEAPGKPFDVTEYGAAATQVAAAAHELNGLVTTLDASMPEVQRTFDDAAARGTRVVDHAFVRGLQLGGILIAAAALAVLAVRWISARMRASKTPLAG